MTSVNERQYQLPFCQVLAAEGETILYVSTHGPFEKGKDIITRTGTGQIRAYQLKAGDIGLTEWRQIYGEIVNLVELAIELPGAGPIVEFVPYLVTNGELTDPVLEQVRVANASWRGRGIHKALNIVQKGELFERFRASHGSFLPHEIRDFRNFLELVLHDGAAPADKQKAAQLFERLFPPELEKESPLNVARVAASIVLLSAYIAGSAALASNHWCVFEYWVLAGAYVLYLIEKRNNAESECKVSFGICESAAESALGALANECAQRTEFIQGFPLIDGHTYRPRITLLLGLLNSWDLYLKLSSKPIERSDFIKSFTASHLAHASMWGESAVPYLFLTLLAQEQACRSQVAEQMAVALVRDIAGTNGPSGIGRGLPNPYYSAEEALRLNYGLDPLNAEQFLGLSYSACTLIHFLARRWRRQALAGLWFGVTRMAFVEYVPASSAEWFRWHSSDGVLSSRLPNEPQSWQALTTEAEQIPLGSLPRTLAERPAFALWFILVYPHRFTPAIAKLIEDTIWKSVA